MKEENKIHETDADIRQLMQSVKQKAPENLKYRIMQQIETEEALKRKVKSSPSPSQSSVVHDFLRIFGTMYALLALLIGAAYAWKGREFVTSSQFLGILCLITVVFALFWLITQIDARVQRKRKK